MANQALKIMVKSAKECKKAGKIVVKSAKECRTSLQNYGKKCQRMAEQVLSFKSN